MSSSPFSNKVNETRIEAFRQGSTSGAVSAQGQLFPRFDDPHRGLDLAEQALHEAAPLRSKRIADDVRMLTRTAAPLERDKAFRPRVRELRRTAKRVGQAVA